MSRKARHRVWSAGCSNSTAACSSLFFDASFVRVLPVLMCHMLFCLLMSERCFAALMAVVVGLGHFRARLVCICNNRLHLFSFGLAASFVRLAANGWLVSCCPTVFAAVRTGSIASSVPLCLFPAAMTRTVRVTKATKRTRSEAAEAP